MFKFLYCFIWLYFIYYLSIIYHKYRYYTRILIITNNILSMNICVMKLMRSVKMPKFLAVDYNYLFNNINLESILDLELVCSANNIIQALRDVIIIINPCVSRHENYNLMLRCRVYWQKIIEIYNKCYPTSTFLHWHVYGSPDTALFSTAKFIR